MVLITFCQQCSSFIIRSLYHYFNGYYKSIFIMFLSTCYGRSPLNNYKYSLFVVRTWLYLLFPYMGILSNCLCYIWVADKVSLGIPLCMTLPLYIQLCPFVVVLTFHTIVVFTLVATIHYCQQLALFIISFHLYLISTHISKYVHELS